MATIHLGSTSCHFIARDQLLRQVQSWLKGNKGHHIVTLNPEMVVAAEYNAAFRQAVNRADLRIPDGAGLFWAKSYLSLPGCAFWKSVIAFLQQPAPRLTGIDLIYDIAHLCQQEKKSVYLVGGTKAQAEGTQKKLQVLYPSLTIHTSPAHQANLEGPSFLIDDIHQQKPTVVLVAYGAPMQSLWIDQWLMSFPSVKIAVGVGGALAIISQEKKRAPRWMRNYNLEWVWRLVLEPRRFFRIWQAVISFPRLIMASKKEFYTAERY